jgi:hypothetical protein
MRRASQVAGNGANEERTLPLGLRLLCLRSPIVSPSLARFFLPLQDISVALPGLLSSRVS